MVGLEGAGGNTVGQIDFLSRELTLLERVYVGLLDALVATARFILARGGPRLKRLLIRWGARVAYRLLSGRRHIVHTNLALVYGDELGEVERHQLAQKAFQHYVRFTLDFLFDDLYWPASELRERVIVGDTQALDAAFEEGRGVVVFSAHLG